MNKFLIGVVCLGSCLISTHAQSKHSPTSQFPTYEGRVMCGYQGWFRAEGDNGGSGRWVHFNKGNPLTTANYNPDLWPDMTEYTQTYPTAMTNQDGTVARLFSSADQSTTDLHFKWMKDYGIDGVFVQRFFGDRSRVILGNALKSSQKYGRAVAVMYDLSGLRPNQDCSATIIPDWKMLVDELKVTSQPTNNYLYHKGKPLVVIWGLGFPDRPYDIKTIGMEKLINFLKNDPEYGGCSVMLGVPTYFRDLNVDTNPDPYLHKLIEMSDIVMPWMVQRFTPLVHLFDAGRYEEDVKADIAWCAAHHVDYAPCVSAGFSWYNMHTRGGGRGGDSAMLYPLNQIPRQKGRFYWNEISGAIHANAKMLYVAMFDEMDEGTAIFKCSNNPPPGLKVVDYEGMPTDHYLWLTGKAGQMLRKEIPFTTGIPARGSDEKTLNPVK